MMFIRFNRISFALALPAIAGLLLAGCSQKNDAPMNRGGGSGQGAAPVEALIVRPQILRNTIFTTGTLLANEEVELRSEISGRVTGVYFEEGKKVKQGEPLLKINDRELRSGLKRLEVEEKQASDDERRKRGLFEGKLISQEEYDKAVNALQIIQAEKEALESQLAKTEIVAPFDGVVGLRYISQGGYITPNVLVATMQDIDPMKVEFSVPEKYAPQLREGAEILVLTGDSPEAYHGKVYAAESKIDVETRTVKARAKIPNPGAGLIPGSFAKIEITVGESPDAILIPSEAVIPRINDEIVYVCRNGQARLVPVKTGIRTETSTQVTEGLIPGDTLIVTGLLQLTDGRGVRITTLQGN